MVIWVERYYVDEGWEVFSMALGSFTIKPIHQLKLSFHLIALFSLVSMISTFFVPETPRFLLLNQV